MWVPEMEFRSWWGGGSVYMCTYICFQNLLLKVGKGWTFHPNRIRNSGSGSSSPKIGFSTSKTAFKFIPLWRVLGEFLQVTEHTHKKLTIICPGALPCTAKDGAPAPPG